MAGGLLADGLVRAQSAVPIKDILMNPPAYHRQAIVVHGKVVMPGEVRGVNAWGQQLCGQQFLLDDETGRMLMRSLMICQPDNVSELRVRHGETVTIEATVEAAPANMQTVTGRGLGFGAMVTHVTHEDLGGTRISIDPTR
ncbi:hypothetical protein YTPLAS18_13890 [Nitrospira sp.]|nr:hypothetical protein YTPLAS18_13890 [Nitrospira sp.]